VEQILKGKIKAARFTPSEAKAKVMLEGNKAHLVLFELKNIEGCQSLLFLYQAIICLETGCSPKIAPLISNYL